jgi:hypothetical protein
MTQVVFQRTGAPAVNVQALFDGKKLKFDDEGVAKMNVAGGGDYSLSWIAKGTPKAAWSLALTSPTVAAFKISKKLPPDGKDSNTEWVYIP